jgi:hypothetical protein
MRMTRAERIVCLLLGVLLIALFAERRGRASYCRQCGLERLESGLTWCGARVHWCVGYRDTEFHRLYSAVKSAGCTHRWRTSTSNYESLIGGFGVGCGHFPRALYHGTELRPLWRLTDHSRTTRVLAALDLEPEAPHKVAVFDAIARLGQVRTHADEERWWQRHRRLFVR